MAAESERLFAMFMGWVLVWYGVRRRDLTGTVTAMAGLGLSIGALTILESVNHNSDGKRP